MALFVLASWLVTVVVGLVALLQWRRRAAWSRLPTRLVTLHAAAAVAGTAVWTVHVGTGSLVAAWTCFVVANVTNGLGDAVLTRRYRMRTAARGSVPHDYGRAVLEIVRGRRPNVALLHALVGAVTYFSTLVACVLATW
ncbi:hypothetical protein [Aeromicrobium sp. CTD01-1L150]|uniref:hypothetical protein n=1 Tax=Aeromicrobium sp. CTD01-1L150 TaxID=3341830 RepID=UPI0035C23103